MANGEDLGCEQVSARPDRALRRALDNPRHFGGTILSCDPAPMTQVAVINGLDNQQNFMLLRIKFLRFRRPKNWMEKLRDCLIHFFDNTIKIAYNRAF